jgi:hypothetical protein
MAGRRDPRDPRATADLGTGLIDPWRPLNQAIKGNDGKLSPTTLIPRHLHDRAQFQVTGSIKNSPSFWCTHETTRGRCKFVDRWWSCPRLRSTVAQPRSGQYTTVQLKQRTQWASLINEEHRTFTTQLRNPLRLSGHDEVATGWAWSPWHRENGTQLWSSSNVWYSRGLQ